MNSPSPGTYRFVVRSVKEAVSVLETRLGPEARVLSVRPQHRPLWKRILEGGRLEIVAELPRPQPLRPSARSADALAEIVAAPAVTGEAAMVDLSSALRKAGFSERLMFRSPLREGAAVEAGRGLADDVEAFVSGLRRQIEVRPLPGAGAPIAFLSDCHADKNLALSQWLSWEVFTRGSRYRVCHVEVGRPNPFLELEVFCQAIGVELMHYIPGKKPVPDRSGLCWDLPWVDGDSEIAAISETLDNNAVITRVLVQNACYEAECLRSNLRLAQRMGATHLVLTHFDQLRNVAKIWDVLIESELSPLFFSANDSLLATVRVDPVEQLAGRTLGSA